MKSVLFVILALLLFPFGPSQAKDELPVLQLLTNNAAPYSYLGADGKVTGTTVKMVQKYMEDVGLKYTINLVDWTAAFKRAKQRTATMIFPLDRTPERENDFYWIKPLVTQEYFLYSRNDPKLNNLTLKEILAGDYKAGCSANTSMCEMLKGLGFPEDRIIVDSHFNIPTRNTLMLKGQFDFTAFDPNIYATRAKEYNLDVTLITRRFKIGEIGAYIAAGKNLDPKILKRLQNTLN